MFGDKTTLTTTKSIFISNLFHKLQVYTIDNTNEIIISAVNNIFQERIAFEPKQLDWMTNALYNVKKYLNNEHIGTYEDKTITDLENIHKKKLEDYEIEHKVLKKAIFKHKDQINKKEYENAILLKEVKFLKDRIQDLLTAK